MLLPIVAEIGSSLVSEVTPRTLRDLGPKLRPDAGTDTWWREIVTPARAVINNAHDLGKCAPIKVKRYTQMQRVTQDQSRGKVTRVPSTPATRDWLEAFRAAADPYNRALAAFMFETAARIGQAVALTKRDLDLMNSRVRLKAQKGHPEQWVTISRAMVVELANLPARRPVDTRRGAVLPARVFGYATPTGYRSAWLTICKRAGIPYLSAHAAGRHGFFTE
ncbi:MAG: site-specific integrase, partial [Gemmobacter sp.]|nr:site-specific integrase [Gemmobacter sp.]